MLTLLGAVCAARYCLDWAWARSLLFGSLVVVTGPTVVTPVVRGLRLRARLASVLEAEGVRALHWGGMGVVVLLVLVIRPLVVMLATLGSELSMRKRLFASWIAPRGIVAAAMASVAAS